MDILSRRFHAEVLRPDGRTSEISFTGEDALAAIAYAEVLAPQIKRLCDGLEQRDSSKGSFDEQLIDVVIAQAALKLSQEVTTDDSLLSRGVSALTALTRSWDRMNELTFQYLARLDSSSPELLRRTVQLQQQERQLAEQQQLLGIFRQLQAK